MTARKDFNLAMVTKILKLIYKFEHRNIYLTEDVFQNKDETS